MLPTSPEQQQAVAAAIQQAALRAGATREPRVTVEGAPADAAARRRRLAAAATPAGSSSNSSSGSGALLVTAYFAVVDNAAALQLGNVLLSQPHTVLPASQFGELVVGNVRHNGIPLARPTADSDRSRAVGVAVGTTLGCLAAAVLGGCACCLRAFAFWISQRCSLGPAHRIQYFTCPFPCLLQLSRPCCCGGGGRGGASPALPMPAPQTSQWAAAPRRRRQSGCAPAA
jgi:hypothetical protein